jgi:hypothetical protein
MWDSISGPSIPFTRGGVSAASAASRIRPFVERPPAAPLCSARFAGRRRRSRRRYRYGAVVERYGVAAGPSAARHVRIRGRSPPAGVCFPQAMGPSGSRCGDPTGAASQLVKTRPPVGFTHCGSNRLGRNRKLYKVRVDESRTLARTICTPRESEGDRAGQRLRRTLTPHNPPRSCLGAAGEDRQPPRPAENPCEHRSPPGHRNRQMYCDRSWFVVTWVLARGRVSI